MVLHRSTFGQLVLHQVDANKTPTYPPDHERGNAEEGRRPGPEIRHEPTGGHPEGREGTGEEGGGDVTDEISLSTITYTYTRVQPMSDDEMREAFEKQGEAIQRAIRVM